MRGLWICSAVALLASCKERANQKEGTPSTGSGIPPASSAAAPASTLTIKKDGAPMKAEHAFVKQLPDGKLQLYVGEGGSCEELLTSLYNGDRPHVLIDLPTLLAASGSESRTVADVYAGPPETADPGGTATVKGDLAKGSKVDIALSFTSQAAKLEVKGSIVAESCGDQDVSKGPLPKAQHPSTATATIANKEIPIKAALLKGNDVELSDFPRDCTSAWFIGVALKRDDSGWHLSGRRFAEEVASKGEGLTVTQGAKGTSDDGPTVQLTLGGEGKVGDYPVKLAGTVEALACP